MCITRLILQYSQHRMTLFSHLAKKIQCFPIIFLNAKESCLITSCMTEMCAWLVPLRWAENRKYFFYYLLSCSCHGITKLRHNFVEQFQNIPSPKSAGFQITLRLYAATLPNWPMVRKGWEPSVKISEIHRLLTDFRLQLNVNGYSWNVPN